MTILELIAVEKKLKATFSVSPALSAVAESDARVKALTWQHDWLAHKTVRITNQSQIHQMSKAFFRLEAYANELSTQFAATKASSQALKFALDSRVFDLSILAGEMYPETQETASELRPASLIVIDESKRVKRIITDIYNDSDNLFKIQPREFEEAIAELLSHQGFKVELTKQTRDQGYDIIALKYIDSHIPLKFLVECKRYTKGKVGVEIIRGFKEVIATENANRGIIVTTSYFTKDAQKKQREIPYLLDYRDKDAVLEWVQNYYQRSL